MHARATSRVAYARHCEACGRPSGVHRVRARHTAPDVVTHLSCDRYTHLQDAVMHLQSVGIKAEPQQCSNWGQSRTLKQTQIRPTPVNKSSRRHLLPSQGGWEEAAPVSDAPRQRQHVACRRQQVSTARTQLLPCDVWGKGRQAGSGLWTVTDALHEPDPRIS